MHRLTTPRLTLRQWRAADLEPFAALNADPAVMEFMPKRLTRAESDALVERAAADLEARGWGLWALEVRESGAFAGCVGLNVPAFQAHFTPCTEILWRLARPDWGRGYATEAARECLRFALETLRLPELVAFTVPANVRSRAVMERLGMRHDPADDFAHPRLPAGHPLRDHVLYRLAAPDRSGRS
ncbi:MAG TPA: GNAT family N-acetyltransferase [Steroidobacteraceae bacterium]|nr:GNAT family N-acetyltransferase [Steroidobacteraceae bacterium]